MGIAVLRLVARRRRPDKRHPSYEGLYKATPESRALIQDRGTHHRRSGLDFFTPWSPRLKWRGQRDLVTPSPGIVLQSPAAAPSSEGRPPTQRRVHPAAE